MIQMFPGKIVETPAAVKIEKEQLAFGRRAGPGPRPRSFDIRTRLVDYMRRAESVTA